MIKKAIYLVIILLYSCDWRSSSKIQEENALARVGSSILYLDDIVYDPSLGDSAEVFNQQIDLWIKKKLLLNLAFQNQDVTSKIDRMVSSYRENLVLFEFEKYLFSTSYNDEISEAEIIKYYDQNINDFILPFNLVRTLYAKIPIDAPGINSFRSNLRKYPSSDTTEIISYCFQFAEKSFLEDSTWIKFDDILMNVPFPAETDKINFLNSRSFYEIKDNDYIHFMRILDKKLIGDFSPISFEQEIINTILLNNRKQYLFDNLRDSIFNSSVNGIDYEVYY